jgi:hypothetical protein
MFSDKTSIESTTGLFAVGSLCLLGIFMFLDGRTEIFSVVENYGKSTVWGIVAAVPTLVVAYIFGMLAVAIAELFFTRVGKLHKQDDVESFIKIATFGNDPITQEYLGAIRRQTLLEGCSVSFITVAIGILSMSSYNPGYERLGYAIAVGSSALAILCPILAACLLKKARALVKLIEPQDVKPK